MALIVSWVLSPDSKDHVANMGPIWGRQVPGGSHVGPMNLAIWVATDANDMWINAYP